MFHVKQSVFIKLLFSLFYQGMESEANKYLLPLFWKFKRRRGSKRR